MARTPAKTPAAVIQRLNQESVQLLNTAQAKEPFLRSGVEAVGSSPEEFGAAVKAEMARNEPRMFCRIHAGNTQQKAGRSRLFLSAAQ